MNQNGTEAYLSDYRPRKLQEGARYQDFIMERMHRLGTVLQFYTSIEGQRKGETLSGWEIKNDQRMRETGNIYIEIAEKAYPRDGDYVPSGIYRNDNSWIYAIGDYQTLYIFAKSTLRNAYAVRHRFGLREPTPTPTSKGFLLPLRPSPSCTICAEQLKAWRIDFDFAGNIKNTETGGVSSPVDLSTIETPKTHQLRLEI